MYENKKLRLCDSLCVEDNSLKMRILRVQNFKSPSAVMWLLNEVVNVPWNNT